MAPALFSTFSLIIACIVKTRERFMGIGQLLTMPIFFASNAIYPIEIMPPWLRAISLANPLTYEVDGLRALMLRRREQIRPDFRRGDPGRDLGRPSSPRACIRA